MVVESSKSAWLIMVAILEIVQGQMPVCHMYISLLSILSILYIISIFEWQKWSFATSSTCTSV
ncbi:hypothetical protein HanPSC8_Chr14g0595731 [Helianthus annuus]|nr:hypothetical protein HanPSC8_Chr14g0595731 [Helianthus annuus]